MSIDLNNLKHKLHLKDEMKGIVENIPEYLKHDLKVLNNTNQVNNLDYIISFFSSIEEAKTKANEVITKVKNNGLIWVGYAKKSGNFHTDLYRDNLWEIINSIEHKLVSLISLDENWSIARIR